VSHVHVLLLAKTKWFSVVTARITAAVCSCCTHGMDQECNCF